MPLIHCISAWRSGRAYIFKSEGHEFDPPCRKYVFFSIHKKCLGAYFSGTFLFAIVPRQIDLMYVITI